MYISPHKVGAAKIADEYWVFADKPCFFADEQRFIADEQLEQKVTNI
jgi:hypothetical protein